MDRGGEFVLFVPLNVSVRRFNERMKNTLAFFAIPHGKLIIMLNLRNRVHVALRAETINELDNFIEIAL